MEEMQRCFSEQELADAIGISYWSVRQLRLQDGLPHFKAGRRVFYRQATVEAWLVERERGSAPTPHNPIRAIK